jgi:hypothetical protein
MPHHLRLIACVVAAGAAVACHSKSTVAPEDTPPSASASAAPSPLEPVAIPEAEVRAALNPAGEPPYSGPIGRVRGVVRVSGDPAPELPDVLGKIPAGKCADARAFYGKLFREGPGRQLGDVLVAVTGYKGYVPPRAASKTVVVRGCAFESRTIAMVFGQRLDVQNRGGETFIPELVGARQAALVVALPGGDPVKLFPDHVGQFQLADRTNTFAKADVFVLKYPMFAVTGLDGAFDIADIPAGAEVLVTAYLPATKGQASQSVKIVAGETVTVDLTIPFAAAKPSPSAAP